MSKKRSIKVQKDKKPSPLIEPQTAAQSCPEAPTAEQENEAEERTLRGRLEFLREELEAGRIKFVEGLPIIDSVKKVRYAPDGSVDLATVDRSVRLLALMIAEMRGRSEMKKSMSLAQIQKGYFRFLETNFGQFYKLMLERRLTPHQAGIAASKSNATIKEITKPLPDLLQWIDQFWNSAGEIAHAHVEDTQNSLNGVFGGDLFPFDNIASNCGLYADTVILPDPFLRTKYVFQKGTPSDKAYYCMKHALALLQYRDLACADISPPVVVVLPDRSILNNSEFERYGELGKRDALLHAGKLFGRSFESYDELITFAETLGSVEKVEAAIADKSRMLVSAEFGHDWRQQVRGAASGKHSNMLPVANLGTRIVSLAAGRMGITNELLSRAQRLRGTPIVDAPTSWQYFVWKLEYDAERLQKAEGLTDLHVLRGLQSLATSEMEWLGKVPPEALLDVRQTGAIAEIRTILARGVEEVALSNPRNFYRTTDRVFDNIQVAFAKHREEVRKLSDKKWKFAGSHIGSWLVAGTLEVAAAATGQSLFGLGAIAANQLLKAPTLRDLPKGIEELKNESKSLARSPVGLLFNYSAKK